MPPEIEDAIERNCDSTIREYPHGIINIEDVITPAGSNMLFMLSPKEQSSFKQSSTFGKAIL